MNVYFDGDFEFAIKVGGEFLGTSGKCVIKKEITLPCFIEVYPVNSSDYFNVYLKEEFLDNPPDFLSVVDLSGGYLLKFNNGRKLPFKVIAQENIEEVSITVLNENGLKISVDSPLGYFLDDLNYDIYDAKITAVKLSVPFIFVELFGNKTHLLIAYSVTDKIRREEIFEIDEFSVDKTLTVIKEYKDVLKHTLKREFVFDGKLTEISREISSEKEYNDGEFIYELAPYIFFESLMLGKDVSAFLSPDLEKNKDKLSEYLGEYVGVIPPPEFRDFSEIGLVKKRSPNSYRIEYYSVDRENGKITNIKKSAN